MEREELGLSKFLQFKPLVATAKSLQSCPTLQPHPWDSPGKNTGVGCHFLLQCIKVKSESEVAQPCLTSRPHGLQPTRLLRPWDFPGKSTGVWCHYILLFNFKYNFSFSRVEQSHSKGIPLYKRTTRKY